MRRGGGNSKMEHRKSERPGRGHETDSAGLPGRSKWTLLWLAVVVALLVLLFDFTAIGSL